MGKVLVEQRVKGITAFSIFRKNEVSVGEFSGNLCVASPIKIRKNNLRNDSPPTLSLSLQCQQR